VIDVLRGEALAGKWVGVQLYSASNPPLLQFLAEKGAQVRPVQPYVYAPAADADRVVQLLQQMDEGKVDAIIFTSSPQVDRLFEVANERGSHDLLVRALRKTKIAAIGPLVADNLQKRQFPVAICPEQGFVMKNLVQLMKRSLKEA
jgi:uroporphyrinogen-III synthase